MNAVFIQYFHYFYRHSKGSFFLRNFRTKMSLLLFYLFRKFFLDKSRHEGSHRLTEKYRPHIPDNMTSIPPMDSCFPVLPSIPKATAPVPSDLLHYCLKFFEKFLYFLPDFHISRHLYRCILCFFQLTVHNISRVHPIYSIRRISIDNANLS